MTYSIIREIYENDNAPALFENELETALGKRVKYIIIEPTKLGDDISLFVRLGNFVHKTAVLSGTTSLITYAFNKDEDSSVVFYFSLSCAFVGWISVAVYTISWQFDPCVKYQVITDKKRLRLVPPEAVQHLSTVSPVVLERRNDKGRKLFHWSLSLLTASVFGWKAYGWFCK